MIRLSTLLLAPPVGERLRARYDDYRQHGASWLSASLGCLWASLVWALMPLETPRWQAILARHETYFPHINPHRPRPLDPLRYLLQSLWLLTTRVPEPEKKVNWRSLAALEGVHGRYTQWLEKLPEQMNARTGHLDKQKELAMMQTPHHFFSPDPFERNLGRFRKTPNEGTLFYGLVQDGNDMWDATFFCGSCAVIRRGPLDEIGGIAVETVTEDAHTSLRLHRRGYTSAYMRIPQAAGLATESLSAHIGQRIRWARGMVQIFRLDNPLFGKGLKLVQRVCYANAMLHFLSGIPRLIFLTAPLAFLLLHAYIIYAPALMIALFVLPHMIHASLTNSKIQGKYRHSFWSEIYETVLAWYIAPPTFVALINPHKGKFNVTAKGGLVEEEYVDWVISRPYIYLVLLNLVGVAVGIWRFMYGPENEILTVWVSIVWVFYNLIILGGAVAVSVESKQVRRSHRVEMSMPAAIAREDGHLFSCTVHDYSDGGLGIKINGDAQVLEGQNARLLLKRGQQEYAFPVRVARVNGSEVGLQLLPLTNQQHIDFVQCTFARADTWALWQDSFPEDKPMESLLDILKLGFRGYRHLAEFSPPSVKVVFRALTSLVAWIASFVPRRPERAAPTLSADPAMAQQ